MTKDQLHRALEIKKEVEQLTEHLYSIKNKVGDLTFESCSLSITKYNTEPTKLIKEFVPIPRKRFIELYIERVKSEIKKLEIEFNNL